MKVTEKGQVTIPLSIRKKMGLLPNTHVEFHVSQGQVILRKAKSKQRRGQALIDTMRGRATRRLTTDQIMAMTRGRDG